MRRNRRPRLKPPAAILVADGEGEAARVLAAHLSRRGFNASHTSSGEDVLSVARTGRLGLAIVDAVLQDMSGYTLASRLKEINAAIPVIMTCGEDLPELEIRARELGILYFAHKPTNHALLQAVVARALGDSKAT